MAEALPAGIVGWIHGADGLAAMYGDPLAIWRRWAVQVEGKAVSCGHFMMEEAAAETGALPEAFSTRGTG